MGLILVGIPIAFLLGVILLGIWIAFWSGIEDRKEREAQEEAHWGPRSELPSWHPAHLPDITAELERKIAEEKRKLLS